ncbi:neural cell adhesion molecule L1.1 isoform X3 [Pygocentrus nattereri]|uniref:Neural cell adhesion molecule L1 n=1 Tax=Pygocentrus nattereri TaxID=42514 RepID=A0A3B4DNG1_PYGNA|nr:neural cell adhesion molecule L1.1 isoform X3 [Pygocentrus nattereri]
MPPAQCQPAATRGQLGAPSRQLLFSVFLLLLLGQTQGGMHIPKDYVINDLKEPPVITSQPESYTAFYLDDVLLKCEAKGNPAPKFRWVKDGKLFEEGSYSSGVITANESKDLKYYQGTYRCFASNDLGTAMSDVMELITEPPPILPKERRVRKTVNEGDDVVLHCNPPNSSVVPYIHWMDKKLLHIKQNERVTIGLDGNLYFANVLVTDTRDDYTCNAQYVPARTILPKEPISLHVNPSNMVAKIRRPRLHRPEGTHSHYLALRGQTLTLECIPHGLPTPTVTWERKDGPLSLDRASVLNYDRWLRFEEILESDDGEYSCTANNSHGFISHTYMVEVKAAPYWTKKPQSQLYAAGETVRLDCQAEGIPTPQITWKINGVPILDTDEEWRRQVTGGTLILSSVSYSDTAVYQCEASNIYGSSLINTYIHIIELPPQMLTENQEVYRVTEGSSASLNCSTFGSPRPMISWETEGDEPVLSNPKMSQMTNGTLLITNVSREDAGPYFCSVKNSSLSITALLDVLNRTQIISPPRHLQVLRGQSGVMQCQYEVDLQLKDPTIVWRKNGQKITTSAQDDKYTVFENGSLKITDVQHKDTGRYSCEVITELDMDIAIGSLTVVDKPDVPHSLQLSEKKSRSVTLSWTPGNENNSPVLDYVIEMREDVHSEASGWKVVEQISAEINRIEIPLLPFCTYHFRVAAINEIGMSDFSMPSESYATPPAKPDAYPKNVMSESTDPDSMVITWEEMKRKHFNGPDFRYKVFWRQSAGQQLNWEHVYVSHPPFIVNNTGTFTAFEIKVQAVNRLGEGPSPTSEIGHSGEDFPEKPPTRINVSQINGTAVNVTWNAVSRESVRGHLQGYKIYLRRLHPQGIHDHRGKRELALRDMEREEESRVIVVYGDRKEQAVLSGLEFYSDYQLSIAAFNKKGDGPQSEPYSFKTPEGVPGPPSIWKLESPSKTELTLYWRPPRKINGVLKGYILNYQEFIENSPSTLEYMRIDDPKKTHFTLSNLNPQRHYFFDLRALTNAGDGDPARVNGSTLLDGEPPSSVNATVGETFVNLSWVPSHRRRNIGFTVHYRKTVGGQWEESEQVNSTQAFYQLQGLQPGTQYVLEIRLSNETFWMQELQTNGPELAVVQNGFASEGWFIGLISAVVLLLLILLILCFIKRSKGGKYSVKDKEDGRVDSEARPIKDETIGEYSSDNDEKRSISQPSLCVESKRASDDSLAEYGDSVDIQFNEDGSFIGQYSGRRDHHGQAGDHDSSGATSPTNPNMPPPSMSFPSSVTGILGGN